MMDPAPTRCCAILPAVDDLGSADTIAPTPLVALVREGVVDPGTAATLAVTVAGGLPVLVAGGRGDDRAHLLEQLEPLRGDGADPPVELDPHRPDAAAAARRHLGAAREGTAFGASIAAGSLEAVLQELQASPFGLHRDELGHLGVVIVLGEGAPGRPSPAVAVHWLRPLTRDAQGHVRRFDPVVLAARDPRSGRWEDFAWGVIPELAARLGRRAGEVERERDALARTIAIAVAEGDLPVGGTSLPGADRPTPTDSTSGV
jgi:hypothetical protein